MIVNQEFRGIQTVSYDFDPLCFYVVGGDTKPINPKENTIWIKNGINITGWTCSIDEPADYIDGWVWIKNDIKSKAEMQILNTDLVNNQLYSYPVRVYQYNGGWRYRDGEIYVNGAWINLTIPIVGNNELLVDDWTAAGWHITNVLYHPSWDPYFAGNLVNGSAFSFPQTGSFSVHRIIYTKNLTISGATNLFFKWNKLGYYPDSKNIGVDLVLCDSNNNVTTLYTLPTDHGEQPIDLSSHNKNLHPGLRVRNGSSTSGVTIYIQDWILS